MRVDKKVSFGFRLSLWGHLVEIRAFGEAAAEALVTHTNPLETESKQSPFSTYHCLLTLPYWVTIKIYYPVLYSQTSTKLSNHLVNKESLVSEWHLGRGQGGTLQRGIVWILFAKTLHSHLSCHKMGTRCQCAR